MLGFTVGDARMGLVYYGFLLWVAGMAAYFCLRTYVRKRGTRLFYDPDQYIAQIKLGMVPEFVANKAEDDDEDTPATAAPTSPAQSDLKQSNPAQSSSAKSLPVIAQRVVHPGFRLLSLAFLGISVYGFVYGLTAYKAVSNLDLGNRLLDARDFPGASAAFRKALQASPDSVNLHYSLARALLGAGKLDQAMAEFRIVMERDPSNAAAHITTGNLLVSLGRQDEAIAEYQNALRIYPYNAITRMDLANIFVVRKRYTEAIEEYKKSINIDKNLAVAHMNLANVYIHFKRNKDAVAEDRLAEAIIPDNVFVHNNLGSALYGDKQALLALQQFKRTTELDPNYGLGYFNQAEVLRALGRTDEAVVAVQKFIHLAQMNPKGNGGPVAMDIALKMLAGLRDVQNKSTIVAPPAPG